MLTNQCKLLDLPEDVLLEVICACDVEDVVRLGMVRVSFYQVCFVSLDLSY